jgi:hypothetical protein
MLGKYKYIIVYLNYIEMFEGNSHFRYLTIKEKYWQMSSPPNHVCREHIKIIVVWSTILIKFVTLLNTELG